MGRITKVVAIGDSHDKPSRDKARFRWISKFIEDTQPTRVVHIGDFLSVDSCSDHEPKGSKADREASTFEEDLESGIDALDALHSARLAKDLRWDITLGNHENRARRKADAFPRECGDMPRRLKQLFARYGWKTHDYGEWLMVDGVGFVHIPLNIMGRPLGGENVSRNIATKATHSVVHGHCHRFQIATAAKLGAKRNIQVFDLGTSLPNGELEPYTPLASMHGWTYGCVSLVLKDGEIIGHQFVSMIELEEKYA
jgi:hypothetical protein